ncbi:hypothetical protein [Streptomyces sp. ALI-76-A]|jgi:hypothetical protein|uniref:hypothetical protein n=1 Tax=Streptomyces sp. ALI-76-A TaxID=3025736 RepID=UPI00256EEB0A|nr:hypothetical protein [Streptomyces sp. ALI-76-A]MDL5205064.1 hypothetical protein [Streptomyces sp. ALI-76-A]
MAGAAGTAVVGGLSVVVYGTIVDDLPRTLGGTCLTLTALTLLALILIRNWIVDTRDERRILAAAQRETVAERSRYFAAQAALENEQGRLNRDMAAERAGLAARLQAEREALAAEFEERRATVIAETMEATFRMFHDGKFAPGVPEQSKVIQLREHQQQRHPERERSREHGVVRP